MPTDKFADYIREHRDDFDAEAPPLDLWDKIEESIDGGEDDSDPLAEFVVSNRDAFDNQTPPPRVEGQIFAALGAAPESPRRLRPRRFISILSIAASVMLILSLGYYFGNQSGYASGQQDQLAGQLEALVPELMETETFYQREIAAQFTKVNAINSDPQLRSDLAEMDLAAQEIREALLEVPASQRPNLINQLIETYQTKLDILVRIQQHVNPRSPSEETKELDHENI